MNWLKYLGYLAQALAILASHAVTFRVGAYQVSGTDTAGKPVHLTVGQIVDAIMMVESGKTGSVTSGDVTIAVSLWT